MSWEFVVIFLKGKKLTYLVWVSQQLLEPVLHSEVGVDAEGDAHAGDLVKNNILKNISINFKGNPLTMMTAQSRMFHSELKYSSFCFLSSSDSSTM